MASIQLRTLVDNVLLDTSRDMREQADSVDVSFHRRVEEVEDAKSKLEDNLQKAMNCFLVIYYFFILIFLIYFIFIYYFLIIVIYLCLYYNYYEHQFSE